MSLLAKVNSDELAQKVKSIPQRFWNNPIMISGSAYYLDRKTMISNIAMLFDQEDTTYVSFKTNCFVPAGNDAVLGPQAFPLARHSTSDWPREGIFAGLTAIVGGKGAGKSYHVAKKLDTEVIIRYGEPVEDYDLDERAVHVASFLDAIELAFILALAGIRVAIDSFRTLIYGLKGAAGEKGIKAEIFNLLTDLSNFFGYTGNTVIGVLNPLVSDEAMETVFSNSASSTVGAYYLSKGQVVSAEFRTVNGRFFEGTTIAASDAESVPDRVPNKGSDISLDTDVGDAEGPRGPRSDRSVVSDDEEYATTPRRGARITFNETE